MEDRETFDRKAYELAKLEADKRFPIPNDTPATGAIRYGLAAFLAVVSVEILLPLVGLWWAGFLTIALGALIGWADTKGRYQANSKLTQDLYKVYRETRG